MDQSVRVAVIVDLVGSRRHADRTWVHRSLLEALQATNQLADFDQPLEPTLGDESQGRYVTLEDAIRATFMLRLLLPEDMDCRAGIGIGPVEELGVGIYGPIQDGPAWWAARDAIVEAKTREAGQNPTLRTWYEITDHKGFPSGDYPSMALINAYFLARDEVVSQMSERSRRLLFGLLSGKSQVEMAQSEAISQSAVSQNLRRSGAAAVLSSLSLVVG